MSSAAIGDLSQSLGRLEHSTESLAEASVQLGAIYFGPSGLEDGITRFVQLTTIQQEKIDLLRSSLLALELGLAGVSDESASIGAVELPSFERAADEVSELNRRLAGSRGEIELLNTQLNDIPLKIPELTQGFIAVAASIEQSTKAQSIFNESMQVGIALHGEELAQAVISAAVKKDSARDASLAIIRAKFMEAMVGYIASVFTSVPFPANLILAAGAEFAVGKMLDSALAGAGQISVPKFAQGGDFVTSGPQLIMVGDNPSGRERVQITPSERPIQRQNYYSISITAPLVDEAVIDSIGPAIEKARRLGKTDIMTRTYDAD